MTRDEGTWKVRPHGALTQLAENVYTVASELKMPLGVFERRMTVVRLSSGRLAIWSAVNLAADAMDELEALGQPAFLIVPNPYHRLDAPAWLRRYPDLRVLAPRGAESKVAAVVPVHGGADALDDPHASLSVVGGMKEREFAMLVRGARGTTLIVNDLIFNLPGAPGMAGLPLRLLGFAVKKPAIPRLIRAALVANRAVLRAQLEQWAAIAGLELLVVSHGAPIANPASTLRELAAAL